MSLTICRADYHRPQHAAAILSLLNHYAEDPMGGGCPLPEVVRKRLIDELSRRTWALSMLAFKDNCAVGLINAFEGFSTFAASPLINIHDVVVLREYRGLGIARAMLSALEEVARRRGCCKLTLEVLGANVTAKATYRGMGFAPYSLGDETGSAEFWQKPL